MKFAKDRRVGKRLKIGMLFPGQGSQYVGMGKDLYDHERVVQEHFEDASLCLNTSFIQLCFASSEEMLRGTLEMQTAIFVVSASIYALLEKKYGLFPDLVAGHSLGESSAVYAAGGMNFPDALYLLKKRADCLQPAIEAQDGGMLAVLGPFSEEKLQAICEQYDEPGGLDKVAELACFNSPSQRIISGTRPELECIMHDVQLMGGKAVMLPIEGAFHSRLFHRAEQTFAMYLVKADFLPIGIPMINNVMAQKITTPEEIKLSLVRQTSSHIFWWQSMQYFKEMDLIIELGPNDKFTKMIKREWPGCNIMAINNERDIEMLMATIERLEAGKE